MSKMRNTSNAYMLVYVRVHDWDNIMCDVGEQHLQDHVRERLQREKVRSCTCDLVTDQQGTCKVSY